MTHFMKDKVEPLIAGAVLRACCGEIDYIDSHGETQEEWTDDWEKVDKTCIKCFQYARAIRAVGGK